jgi:hypothetical protein
VRVGLLIGLIYVAILLSCREWRVVARAFVTHTPWQRLWQVFVRSSPTSGWRGIPRIVGLPIAWCFAALMLTLIALIQLGIEIVLSPKAIYCQAIRLSRWFSKQPDPIPPHHAGALAMPHPEPMLFTDARSRLRVRSSTSR